MPTQSLREIKTILLATGLTTESVGATQAALRLAERFDAQLHAVHVIEPISDLEERAIPGLAATHLKQSEDELHSFASAHGLSDRATLHVIKGRPDTEILRFSQQLNADLLIMGRYGKGGLKRGHLGSIAASLVRLSPIPVLLVAPELRGPFTSLGVASDLEARDHIDIRRALDLVQRLGLPRLAALNAYRIHSGYHTVYTYDEACARLEQVSRDVFAELIQHTQAQLGSTTEIEYHLAEGRPDAVLPELALEIGLDLLVIETHGRSAAASVLMRQLSEHLIDNVHCSVWAERSPSSQQGLRDAIRNLLS